MPMKTCADTRGRIASSVTPSAASRTSRMAAVAPVSRRLPSLPPVRTSGRAATWVLVSLSRDTSSTGPMGAERDERTMRAVAGPCLATTMDAMRVLVVEDEPKLAGLLARGLGEEGHPTDVAATGHD